MANARTPRSSWIEEGLRVLAVGGLIAAAHGDRSRAEVMELTRRWLLR